MKVDYKFWYEDPFAAGYDDPLVVPQPEAPKTKRVPKPLVKLEVDLVCIEKRTWDGGAQHIAEFHSAEGEDEEFETRLVLTPEQAEQFHYHLGQKLELVIREKS